MAPAEFASSVEDHYRPQYFEAIDLITGCIKNRFDQPGYRVYFELQNLLLKAAYGKPYSSELESVVKFYGTDLDDALLATHLQIFQKNFSADGEVSVSGLLEFFEKCPQHVLQLMSQVGLLVKLLLVMLATNASSERIFSAMRRIKSYLRSTMSQRRLNHLMLVHVHKGLTDQLSAVNVANDFIAGNDHRQHVFGMKFIDGDL